jgi:membrane carboxypeptidase/penicillin-binding protein
VALSSDGAVRHGRRPGLRSCQFNRATQAQASPPAFKPFVYLAGLEVGLRLRITLSTRRSESATGSHAITQTAIWAT